MGKTNRETAKKKRNQRWEREIESRKQRKQSRMRRRVEGASLKCAIYISRECTEGGEPSKKRDYKHRGDEREGEARENWGRN